MSTPETLPHTKLPWKLHTLGGYSLLVSESGPLVAKLETVVQGFVVPIGDAIANARFILVACNNYDSLRARLAEVEKELAELKTKLAYAEDAAAKGDLARQCAGGMELEIKELKESNAKLVKDKERLDKQEQMRWAVLFNTHNHKWTVQKVDQVVGNLGDGNGPRQAIDAAIAKGTQ